MQLIDSSQIQDLYETLRGLARRLMMGERTDHTLQATALAHEAILRLRGTSVSADPERFLAQATEAMRRVLIDHARARLTQKRGGEWQRLPLSAGHAASGISPEQLVAVHECLDRFAEEDPVKAELVKLRVFGGLSRREAAAALGLSRATADRYWAYARLRLYVLSGESAAPGRECEPAVAGSRLPGIDNSRCTTERDEETGD